MFLWVLAKEKLLMNASRAERHLSVDEKCPRCKIEVETNIHTIYDCSKIRELWQRLVHQSFWASFFVVDMIDRLIMNMKQDLAINTDGHWRLSFGITCWSLWMQ